MTGPGVVYTKDWIVDFVLDVAGYTVDGDLLSGYIIEPSCGDGAFLSRIVAPVRTGHAGRDALS